MPRTRKAALLLLRSTFVLLCKLLLVDVVCPFIGDWLLYAYFFSAARGSSSSTANNMRSQQDLGIQVIICGISRSGSTSLSQAMDILGFPCFHGVQLVKPSTATLFMKAEKTGDHKDWEKLLRGYTAIADYPAACFYKKLMEMYPKSKIILNTRDPERWYNSFAQTMLTTRKSLVIQVVQPCITRCVEMPLNQKLLMGKPEDKELSISNYKLHAQEVKRHVPAHNLFVLDIEKNKGWAPLCEFLEVPIPNVPFPFINKRESFESGVLKIFIKINIIVLISYLALIFSAIAYTLKCIFFQVEYA